MTSFGHVTHTVKPALKKNSWMTSFCDSDWSILICFSRDKNHFISDETETIILLLKKRERGGERETDRQRQRETERDKERESVALVMA